MLRRHVPVAALAIAVSALVFNTATTAQRATAKPGGGGVNTKARQGRPIQLGTSGGNALDLANGFCCGGTLGALVQRGGNQYILSNTHVFAGDVAPGGNNRVTQIGDPVNQPGLIDTGCQNASLDRVGAVTDWSVLGTDNIDAAIAEVAPGTVRTDGAILGIGPLSPSVAAATVGMPVKKTGRTTGFTRSSISALNATINVGYSNECGGGSFTARFTGQIVITNRGSRFLDSGDSGSLMVEDVASNPRAVGLLFAGSSSSAIANPIQEVLGEFGLAMVGGTSVTATGGTGSEGKNAGAQAQGLTRAMAVQARHGDEFFEVPGAVGHGVGLGNGNAPVIKIFVRELTPEARAAARASAEGIPVVLEEIGDVRALPACVKAAK